MASKKLAKYRSMRDFEATPEPAGGRPSSKAKRPIFVIQKHHASHLHYDFRLEMEGVLKSWAIPKGPSYDPEVKRLAMMTEDHPYDYAGFEGVIPQGNYGAGNVIIWDQGTWEFLEPGDDPAEALAKGKLTFRMYGKKMFGEWALVRIHGRSPRGNEWLLLKHRDEFAAPGFEVTTVAPRSVVSNREVDDVGSARVWQSNRKSSSRKVRTVASALEDEEKPKRRRATDTKAGARVKGGSAVGTARKATTGKRASSKKRASPSKKRTTSAKRR